MSLSDDAKLKILQMSGRELFQHLQERHDLSPKQKMEINKFWLEQHNIKLICQWRDPEARRKE